MLLLELLKSVVCLLPLGDERLLAGEEELQASVEELEQVAQVDVERLLGLVLEQIELLVERALLTDLLGGRDEEPRDLGKTLEQPPQAVALIALQLPHQPVAGFQSRQPVDQMHLVLGVLHQADELVHLLAILERLPEQLLDVARV